MNSIARTLSFSLAGAATIVFIVALTLAVTLEFSQDPLGSGCLAASRLLREATTITPDGKVEMGDVSHLIAPGSDSSAFWYAVSFRGEVFESSRARRPKLPFDLTPSHLTPREARQAHLEPSDLCLDVQYVDGSGLTLMAAGFSISPWQFTRSFLSRIAFEISVIGVGFAALVAFGTLMSRYFVGRSIRRVTDLALVIDPRNPKALVSLETVPVELVALITALNEAFDEINAYVLRQRRFIGNAAHELRTPLTLLRAKLESVSDPALRAELVQDLRRLTSLVAAMLDLAQLQASAVEKELVDLDRVSREVLADLAPSALDGGIELSFERRGDGPSTVIGVEAAIRSAIANIVGNALLHATGTRLVTATLHGAEIMIADDGEGLPPGEAAALIEPFRKGRASRGAAGLGLSIVREIMALHGGNMCVGLGSRGGTVVTLTFRPHEAEAQHLPPLGRVG